MHLMFFRILLVALSFTLGAPAMVGAQVHDVSQAVTIELLPGWRRDDGVHVAALRIRLAPGWKTYWRSAGAAGISPQMDWRRSDGIRSVTPAWPTPTVFRTGGALSIGYDSDFILPLLVATGPGPAVLQGRIDLGVCSDICLPARVDVRAQLDPGGAPDRAVQTALSDQPRRVKANVRCLFQPIDHGYALTGQIQVPSQGRDEAVVFETPDRGVWVTDAQMRRSGDQIDARAQLLASGRTSFAIDRSRMRITVIGALGAVEVLGCTG